MVQSPGASAEAIDQAVSQFSKDFESRLASLDEARLEREKKAVISQLLEQERQLGDISSRYWREIDRSAYGFDSRKQLARAIQAVSKQALLDTFRKAVLKREQALKVVTDDTGGNGDQALSHLRERPPVPAG